MAIAIYNGSVGEALLERIAEIISRYSMVEPGYAVGVAVSGGADSVALLHILFSLAPRWNLRLRVLHLDHGLRGEESREDARFVAALAQALGLPVEIRAADVAGLACRSGENLEQAARDARFAFFRELLTAGTVDRVALGHTRSDQAETVLYRLLRGAGAAGLAGIRPVTRDGFIRPLIETDRGEILAFLKANNIPWREDSSNLDLRFDRNRIRHQLLPQLVRDWNPALPQVLARMAAVAHDEECYWEAEIDRLAPSFLVREPSAVLLRLEGLSDLPRAAVRRLIRRAVSEAKGDLRRFDFLHIERLRELAESRTGAGRLRLPGLEAVRSFGWLRLAPPAPPTPGNDYRYSVSAPGRYPIPGSGKVICLERIAADSTYPFEKSGYNTGREGELDGSRLSASLELRNWRPGDRFRPGGRREAKLKELFQQARIPAWERAGWPVLTSGNRIVWTRRFGVAEGFAPTPGSREVLRVRETRQENAC